MRQNNGVSLIEILIGILLITIASIATLNYFAYGLGAVDKTGNRRAALERARERLEQLMEAPVSPITPTDELVHQVTCNAGACSFSGAAETIPVNGLSANPSMISTIQWLDDPSAGTTSSLHDVLALEVKVWFIPNSLVDDDFHRVLVRTLRTP